MTASSPGLALPLQSSAIVAGRYEIVRVLGRGGMGTVYEAVHTWTGRRVALKALLPHLADDPHAVERFRREARAGVQGAHPNIVEVLDMGVDADRGVLYCAQELLVGEELTALLAREAPLAPRAAYELLVPVMAALDVAHRAGVVHRDIKPSNLFVARSPDGAVTPKLIDFGIASLADATPITATHAPLGTPRYMSPEQARGARDIDDRTDIWSMGCVWFESLSGRSPIEGDGYHAVMAKLMTSPTPSLRAVREGLPEALYAAIDDALRPDRASRHASMAAFAHALLAVPEFAGEAWIAELQEAYPFRVTSAVTLAREARDEPPITLDLPPELEIARSVSATPTPARTPEPVVRRGDRTDPPPAHRAGSGAPRFIVYAFSVVLLAMASWYATRDRGATTAARPSPRVVTPVAARQPAAQTVSAPIAPTPLAPAPPEPSPPSASPRRLSQRVRVVLPARPGDNAAPVAPARPGINGAPVLEP